MSTESSASASSSIAALMQSSGPTVRCVLLRHMRPSGRDAHPHVAVAPTPPDGKPSASEGDPPHSPKPRELLTELMEEVRVDTTPGQNGVQQALGGGPFTFLGQYPDEGIVLMARADQFADLDEIDALSIRELQQILRANPDIAAIDPATLLDKSDLVQAVKEAQLPINPHVLQPPLDDCTIRGDILIMRVADHAEDDEDDEVDPATQLHQAMEDFTSTTAIPNDEFFLDYTKEEYIAFASRTDIVAPPMEEDDEEEEEEDEDYGDGEDQHEDDDEDDDEEFTIDSLDDEEDKRVLLNLILGEVIKSFRHENGRGPDSEELLELRSQVAEKLHLSLPPRAPPVEGKRKAGDHVTPETPSPKRVKFTPEILSKAAADSEPATMNGAAQDEPITEDNDDDVDDLDQKESAVETPEEEKRLDDSKIDGAS